MRTSLEIEAKYELDDAQPLPDLVGVGGVAAVVVHADLELTAVYFDTAAHALADAGATLRRRTGGEDDGWHLKLSLADRERLEVHRDLGRTASPPAALTSLVRALVRSSSLVPVATLVNHRSVHHLVDAAGRVLAEMADDRVTGVRHADADADAGPVTWRELEVELVDGDRTLLAELDTAVRAAGIAPAGSASKVARVLGAGAASRTQPPRRRRKTPVTEVLRAGLRSAVTDLLGTDPLLRLDRPGAPARMRAAVARLRAAVALHAHVVPAERAAHVRAELAWLESVVTGVDELDAAGARIREALAEEPENLVPGHVGHVGRRVDLELATARRTASSLLRKALDSQRYLDLIDVVSRAASAAAPAGDRAGDVLPDLADRAVRRAERRILDIGRGGVETERGVRLLRAERAVERARYAESLASGAAGRGRMAELLDDLATLLRDEAASVRAQELVRGIGVRAHGGGESDFTLGRLHGLEQMHTVALHRHVDKLRKQLKRLRTG